VCVLRQSSPPVRMPGIEKESIRKYSFDFDLAAGGHLCVSAMTSFFTCGMYGEILMKIGQTFQKLSHCWFSILEMAASSHLVFVRWCYFCACNADGNYREQPWKFDDDRWKVSQVIALVRFLNSGRRPSFFCTMTSFLHVECRWGPHRATLKIWWWLNKRFTS
jgi:hypothetical protein